MRAIILFFCFFTSAHALSHEHDDVAQTIDALHTYASEANGKAYFALFDDSAIFIGTDASETWTVDEFKAYATPHFDKGRGWTYTVTERNIYFSANGNVAWFDELLYNESLGVTRGTGVLEKSNGQWKFAQYHLAIPVPNALADDIADQIKAYTP
ncbi:nuclear transport factor 2 family protein [Alteromonas sp. KUL49]|uniref:nuclear transport factor 2 family protein n=1 Tax=Alteromonas sp. KUL49 TaxID=2480798 RepID=UPI00102EE010|nr:nuclear transport factor 2 family protein [Alteromonas sp. KUL49]TAP42102.1 protein with SnoaL 3 domain, NTF 2 superfamily [Alteromonas sp. KUL49]GEA09684.1 hypothetical protein KUL49_00590 [Alteromonas sp. KUL49]